MKNRPGILFWIMLVVGLGCSACLLFGRAAAEEKSGAVACAVLYDDVLLLSGADGRPAGAWLADLKNAGVSYLVVTDENEAEGAVLADAAGMPAGRAGYTAKPGDAFLMPPAPARGVKGYEVPGSLGGDAAVPLALVENYDRTGVAMPEGFDPDNWDGPMVKTLYMYDAYAYHYVPAEPACENENILFRAVTDRSMRLVVVTPLEYEGGGVVADPAAYEDMLSGLSERIAERGLTLGRDFSVLEAPPLNRFLLAGAVLAAAAMAVLFLTMAAPVKPAAANILLAAGAAASAGGGLLLPALTQKLAAFGAAALAPCFTAILLCRAYRWKSAERLRMAGRFIGLLAAVLGISAAGGLYTASLLGSRQYMLEFSVFAGVKLAQMLPLAVTVVFLFFTLRRFPYEEKRRLPRALVVFLLAGVGAALVVVLLRSGDNMIPVTKAEIAVRTWLEFILYARPRTKEMLIAFPALALFTAACARRIPLLALPFGVLAEVGSVSVVNTFCHTFTAVKVSFIRTLLSAGIGLAVGLAALAVFCLLVRPADTQPSGSAER